MAMTRVCDICEGKSAMAKAYQFSVPALLIDNDGKNQPPSDSSQTDVCDDCIKDKTKSKAIVGKLVEKATPAVKG